MLCNEHDGSVASQSEGFQRRPSPGPNPARYSTGSAIGPNFTQPMSSQMIEFCGRPSATACNIHCLANPRSPSTFYFSARLTTLAMETIVLLAPLGTCFRCSKSSREHEHSRSCVSTCIVRFGISYQAILKLEQKLDIFGLANTQQLYLWNV